MVGRPDLYQGNILFYDYLASKRTPTFLNRNLVKALQCHQLEVNRLADRCSTSDLANTRLESHSSSTVGRTRWEMPSAQEFDTLVEDAKDKEAFVLEIKGIEPLSDRDRRSIARTASKKAHLFSLTVDVIITILEPNSAETCQRISRADVKMTGIRSENGQEILLAIRPITFKLNDLLRSMADKGETYPKPWNLMISINLRSHKDAEQLQSHMLPHQDIADGPANVVTSLIARHTNILKCPDSANRAAFLPFSAHGKQLKFGLKINLYWTKPKQGSILTAYNNRQRSTLLRPTDYPSPPLESPVRGDIGYLMIYAYPDRKIERRGLACPHCLSVRKYNTVDDLRLHLSLLHSNLKYEPRLLSNSGGIETWEWTCNVDTYQAEQQRASNAALDPREHQVVAPKIPFDQKSYLDEGNEAFQKEAQSGRNPTSQSSRNPPSQAAPVVALLRKPKAKLPNDVMERVKVERKRYKVPEAPANVTFFRSITKRPLQEGEYISESDDEVETDWIELKRSAQTNADTSILESTKRFLSVFEPFVTEERLQSNIHVGDAMVRFARSKAAVLWQNDTRTEFQMKLDDLFDNDIITEEIRSACLKIVEGNKPTAIPEPQRPSDALPTRNKGKGKARMTYQIVDFEGDVQMRDATHDDIVDKLPPYDQCLCGKDAMSTRGPPYVVCEGLVSNRNLYKLYREDS
jgi:hypothetical protein